MIVIILGTHVILSIGNIVFLLSHYSSKHRSLRWMCKLLIFSQIVVVDVCLYTLF